VLTEVGAILRERAVRVAAELDAAQEAISPEGDVRYYIKGEARMTVFPA
jgi:DNA-binding transcriptional LysR family regulator